MSEAAKALDPEYRKILVTELMKLVGVSSQLVTAETVFWRHFTDLVMADINIDFLRKAQLVWLSDQPYKPNATWQDNFPPKAYRLTGKGLAILNQPARWIRTGEWG